MRPLRRARTPARRPRPRASPCCPRGARRWHAYEDRECSGHHCQSRPTTTREAVAVTEEASTKDQADAARRERFNVALDGLTPQDLNAYLRRVPIDVSRSVMARLPIKLDPRFVKGGVG